MDKDKELLLQEYQEKIAQLERKVAELSEEKYALMEACRIMNSTLETKPLLDLILFLSQQVMKAEASSLLLINEAENHLYFHVAHGDKANKLKNIKVPLGENSIAGWVALNKKPVLIEDAQKDKRWFKGTDEKTGFVTRSMIAVPLISKDKSIGVIEVLNKKDGGLFNEEDLKLLLALSDQAGNALEKSFLYEGLAREKKRIEKIISSMGDGIIVTDKDYKVILYNKSVAQVFKISDPKEGIPQKLALIIDEIKNYKEDTDFDVYLMKPENVILDGRITHLWDGKGEFVGLIIAFRNVTESKRNERIRAEFLAFVSHKLVDPLNELEIIVRKSGEDKNWENFEFLKSRIYQLMFFSELEAGPLRLDRTNFDFISLLESIMEELQQKYRKKKIKYHLFSNYTNISIIADRERIYHSFYAICRDLYTRGREGSTLSICIEDYDIERINVALEIEGELYEQKFVSQVLEKDFLSSITHIKDQDKSNLIRDNQLNLIFAKHTVDAHGGKIAFENLEKGVKVDIILYKEI